MTLKKQELGWSSRKSCSLTVCEFMKRLDESLNNDTEQELLYSNNLCTVESGKKKRKLESEIGNRKLGHCKCEWRVRYLTEYDLKMKLLKNDSSKSRKRAARSCCDVKEKAGNDFKRDKRATAVRENILCRENPPLAPHNTSQFIMEQHKITYQYYNMDDFDEIFCEATEDFAKKATAAKQELVN